MPEAIILEPALRWSGALRRKIGANVPFQEWLIVAAGQTLTPKAIHQWFDELKGEPSNQALPIDDVRRILRQLRDRVFFTVLLRDINGLASLQEVVTAMSALADLAVQQAKKSVDRKSTRLNSSH